MGQTASRPAERRQKAETRVASRAGRTSFVYTRCTKKGTTRDDRCTARCHRRRSPHTATGPRSDALPLAEHACDERMVGAEDPQVSILVVPGHDGVMPARPQQRSPREAHRHLVSCKSLHDVCEEVVQQSIIPGDVSQLQHWLEWRERLEPWLAVVGMVSPRGVGRSCTCTAVAPSVTWYYSQRRRRAGAFCGAQLILLARRAWERRVQRVGIIDIQLASQLILGASTYHSTHEQTWRPEENGEGIR
eukprot:scaffold27536_cov63-Phaeocystis_antarctica.AAC.2